jgi:peptidoglycan/LPS O-acetylase OafA/YrhL
MSIGPTPALSPFARTPAPLARPRYAGLDGLRAIAVSLVLVYHLFPKLLPGGFLGVDVFFSISGFLITSLLLTEWSRTGKIRLVDFWQRRARRLLPALGLVLIISTTAALAVGGDLLVGIGRQIAGATLFVSNWTSIAAGSDYFARDAPELFRNTWSLGIEEQFYLLLPLLLLLLLRLPGRGGAVARPIAFGVLGIASAVLMAAWSFADVEPSRVYFGSETHSFGLLLGAALACVLHTRTTTHEAPERPRRQWPLSLAASLGFATLGFLALTLKEGSPESFRGGMQLATLASLVVIGSVTRPGLRVSRVLDVLPMRWVGERSYGIYLWHWPILMIAQAALGPWSGSGVGLVSTAFGVLALTLTLAQLSYRYVEQPVRQSGLRRSLRQLVRLGGATRRQRVVAAVLAVIVLAGVPATVTAIATAPGVTSAEAAIERGRAGLEATESSATQDPAGDDPTAAEQDRSGQIADSKQGPLADPEAPPVGPTGGQLTAIGDSVMLASAPELAALFPGISIDAEVSRGLGDGVGLAQGQQATGELRYALIVGLGTNGPIDAGDLDALRTLTGARPLVLVNAHAERDWVPGVNEMLAGYAATHRGVAVADWTGSISQQPDLLAGDGIHPGSAGGAVYAAAVQAALNQLNEPSEATGYSGPRR